MRKSQKVGWTVSAVLAGLILVAGCSSGDYEDSGDFQVYQGVLPDGRFLVCVSAMYESGLSCDWAHASESTTGG